MNNPNYFQQNLESYDPKSQLKLCAPTALYELARYRGYDMPPPQEYVKALDWERGWDEEVHGWKRKQLCQMLRDEYGVQSATWFSKYTGQLQTDDQIDTMRQHGYVDTQAEIDHLERISLLPSLAEIAMKEMVVITVEAGFAHNKSAHAVVLRDYDPAKRQYRIHDPDIRNDHTDYPKRTFEEFASCVGAITAILPSDQS